MEIGLFIAALVMVYLLPGPDMVLILHLSHQRSTGIAAALGLALARTSHVVLALAGLVSMLALIPWASLLIRWIGGAYLLWLGIGIWRLGGPGTPDHPLKQRPLTLGQAWRLGLLTNLLNPKALLFCSILLPQFLPTDPSLWPARATLLGSILVGLGFAFDLLYVVAGHHLAQWQRHHPHHLRWQHRLFGGVLISFAILVVVG